MDITIFKDIKQTSQPFYRNINLILTRIQDGASKDIVKKIRAEKDKENRNILKKKLPAICFSGLFSKRADNALKEHSGFICLDFDGYKSNRDLLQEKERLSKDKYV
jgi:deoxyribodipyrimidine photolyase